MFKGYFLIGFILMSSFISNAQLRLEINSGSENIIGFQAGYELSKHIEAGIKYNPNLQILSSLGIAGYTGPYIKYNFSDVSNVNSDKLFSFYLKATIGKIIPPKYSNYDIINLNTGEITTQQINYKSTLGGTVGSGIEMGKGKIKISSELGFGKITNIFKSIFSTDPYSDDVISENTSKVFTSNYYLNFGVTYRFGF